MSRLNVLWHYALHKVTGCAVVVVNVHDIEAIRCVRHRLTFGRIRPVAVFAGSVVTLCEDGETRGYGSNVTWTLMFGTFKPTTIGRSVLAVFK